MFLFMVGISIYGLSIYGKKVLVNIGYKPFAINFLALSQSSCFSFHVNFRLIWYTLYTDMSFLNRNEKLLVKVVVPKLNDLILRVTKRGILLDPLHVLLVPTFQQTPKLKCQ